MARLATTPDVFSAVAEPQRRQILSLLATGEQSVNAVAHSLHFSQSQTSKHLGVLREVGLVGVRNLGKQRFYKLNSEGLKPLHAWVSVFEHLWEERLDRLEQDLKEVQKKGEHL